ncbi:hypothetical protein PIB30_053245 [Stylosanthes scabra]|uniref:FAR1 domain-containing protein n=1 Tax=Stylosanthes scabra TaxID=79078 RepID=A0ABU6XHD0_9FABA|nr:hypothetical protein [Stylosanthes scabra]
MVFTNDGESYEFYKEFEKYHGVRIQKGDCKKDELGNVTSHRFFCNRKYLREAKHYNRVDMLREHKPETRINCQKDANNYFGKRRRGNIADGDAKAICSGMTAVANWITSTLVTYLHSL